MGIIRQGILGGFVNKTGSVVGSYWRTLDVIRGLPRKTGKQPTQKQKDQQLRFALITGFLSWFSGLIHTGFSSVAKVTTPMNVAVRYHLLEAITGVFPNYSIDYAKVKFSVGRLRKVSDLNIDALAGAKLKFTWTHNYRNDKHGNGSDLASFMVYNL